MCNLHSNARLDTEGSLPAVFLPLCAMPSALPSRTTPMTANKRHGLADLASLRLSCLGVEYWTSSEMAGILLRSFAPAAKESRDRPWPSRRSEFHEEDFALPGGGPGIDPWRPRVTPSAMNAGRCKSRRHPTTRETCRRNGTGCRSVHLGPDCNEAETRYDMSTMPTLLVTSQGNKTVRQYSGTTGAFVGVAASGGALGDPTGVVVDVDGNLLVSDGQTNEVKRYDGATGGFLNVVASTHLAGPLGVTIHQGVLYVCNSNSPQGVQCFDAATGVNAGNFVPSLSNASPRDVKVNPANNRLYVLYYNAACVETFDLATKASFGLLLPANDPVASGGLYTPSAMAFGPDGNLYISGGTFGGNLGVRRYNAATGAFIDFFASTGSDDYVPTGIAFGPDDNLYVATQNASNVMRFNYPAGTFVDFFVPDGGGGLSEPFQMTFKVARRSTLAYTLSRDCLDNIGDPGTQSQIEGGKVWENGKYVANYSSVKQMSCGTKEQNTAQLWVTLFFLGENPPQNITLHGAHDFDSGDEIGSVSAASSTFSAHIGKQFKLIGNTLSIG
jgi:WD40 repeat protein